jgi:hypothetical protein
MWYSKTIKNVTTPIPTTPTATPSETIPIPQESVPGLP